MKIEVNGTTYHLRPFTHLEQTVIDDESDQIQPDGSTRANPGSLMSLTCFFSIESWDLKDAKGIAIPLPPVQTRLQTDFGLPRMNRDAYLDFARVFPPRDRMEIFVAASRLNRLGEPEKNSSSGPSAAK